jgi:hypothetical protein
LEPEFGEGKVRKDENELTLAKTDIEFRRDVAR